ncbi:MAG: SpaA isopeptide-forming pilin-related protein, partial [Pyrinomonadaceae bacterium]
DANGNTSEFSNCTVVAGRHKISGFVTVDGQPQKGLLVKINGSGVVASTLTDSQGAYSIQNVPDGAAVTLQPSAQTGINFSPVSRALTVTSDLINQNFTGTRVRFTVSGRVTTTTPLPSLAGVAANTGNGTSLTSAAFNGPFSLTGVTMTLSGAANSTTVTDASGRFTVSNLLPGSYLLTPSKPNFTFNPTQFSFTVSNQKVTEDFTGTSPGLDLLTGRIIYDSGTSIKIMNADSTGLTTLFAGGSKGSSFSQPDLSSDGATVTAIDRSNIFTAKSVGGARTNVRQSTGLKTPRLSPNGTKIAFSDPTPRALVMNVDGSGVTQAANNCSSPDWSNDNVHLVCVKGNIIFTTANGNVFGSTAGTKVSPRWSPDGAKITFIDQTAPNSIKVMNPDGTNVQTILSSNTDQFLSLAWSPDSTRVAYVTHVAGGHGGHKELTAVFADGTGPLVISDTFD